MRIKLTIFLIAAVLFTQQLKAQDAKSITLDEAINLSVSSSKLLKLNQAKIQEASASVKEATEKKLPNAGVSGSYLRLNSANFDLKTNNNSSGSGSSGGTPKVSQAMYGILNVSLPVYQGGKIRYGIESARYLAEAIKLDAEYDKDEVIQNTIEAFANLFKANTAVKLMQENLLAARQRVKDFTNLEKNGLMARNDLLKAELQSSNVELSLLDAQNNLQIANVNMDLMLGLPTETRLMPDTAGVEKRDDGSRVLADYLQEGLKSRKDIAAISYRLKAAETNVKSTRAEKLPNLQLTGGYIAADVPKVFSVTNAVNIGVGVSYNISSLWKTKAKVEQAEAKAKQLAISEAMMDDNITLQVNRAYLSLMSYRKKIEVNKLALEQASENYRIIKNKFDNNLATATDLLDADVAQLQAKLSYTLARADAFVAYNKLLQTAGLLAADRSK